MKTSLTSKILLLVLPLITTSALAHPGHLTNEAFHGFLHIEHIVALAALGVVAYVVKVLRNK